MIFTETKTKNKFSDGTKLILNSLKEISYGRVELKFPNEEEFAFQGAKAGPVVRMKINNICCFDMILEKSDIGLGESYMLGYWETDDISNLIELALLNKSALKSAMIGEWRKIILYKLKHLFNANSKTGSRKNIRAHYDLGNSFYQLWLDRSMTYSSAYWGPQPDLTLQEAQENKYEFLLKHLGAQKGESILEIGCGWGGFAEHAAKQGFNVTGVTISEEQYAYALARIQTAGLAEQAKILFLDYREIQGTFDHVVSIEMLEAVGEKFWPNYFKKINEVVKPGGSVAIQSITIDNNEFTRYRKGTDFIQQYIFPGGMLPSENRLNEVISPLGAKNIQFRRFGLDYAKTLRLWCEKFSQELGQISALGYSLEFQRMWKFYLGYCEGAFRAGQINVVTMSYHL